MSTQTIKRTIPVSKKTAHKRGFDVFWPIVMIICIAVFVCSFEFFSQLTSDVKTRNFEKGEQPQLESMKYMVPKDGSLHTPKKKSSQAKSK